jgi:hypothetical protein
MAAWVVSPPLFDIFVEQLSRDNAALVSWLRFSVAEPVLSGADGAAVTKFRMRHKDATVAVRAYLQHLLRQPGATIDAVERKLVAAQRVDLVTTLHLRDRATLSPGMRAIATPMHDSEL